MANKVEIGINITTNGADAAKQIVNDLKLIGAEARAQSEALDALVGSYSKQTAALGELSKALSTSKQASDQSTESNRGRAKSAEEAGVAEAAAAQKAVEAAEKKVAAAEKAADAGERAAQRQKDIQSRQFFSYQEQEERFQAAHEKSQSRIIEQTERKSKLEEDAEKAQAERNTRQFFSYKEQEDRLQESYEARAAREQVNAERDAQRATERAQREQEQAEKQTVQQQQTAQRQIDQKTKQFFSYQEQEEKLDAAHEARAKKQQETQEKHAKRTQEQEESAAQRQQQRQARFATLPLLGVGGGRIGQVGEGVLSTAGALGLGGEGISGVSSVASQFVALLGPVGIAATATGVVLGVLGKSMFDLVASTAGEARELLNLSERLGVTTADAQKLQIAAELSGVNINSLEQSARLLSAALEDPNGSGKKAADAIQKLGISSYTSKGEVREMGPVLLEFLAKLAEIPNTTERVRTATVVLGRGAKELLPMIENYDELKKTVESFGHQLDESATQELLKADSAIREATVAFELLKKSLSAKIAPIVIDVVQNVSIVTKALAGDIHNDPGSNDPFADDGPIKFGADGKPIGKVGKVPGIDLPDLGISIVKPDKTPGQKAADAFQKAQGATEEGLQSRVSQLRKEREDIVRLLSSGDPDEATRKSKGAELAQNTAETARAKASIEAIHKAKSDKEAVIRELATLQDQANVAEEVGIDKISAKRDNEIEKLRKQHASQTQINQALADYDRIQAAADKRQDEAVQKNKDAGDYRVARNRAVKENEEQTREVRGKFKDSDSTGGIESEYKGALALSDTLYQQEATAANKITDAKRKQEALDNASAEKRIRDDDAEFVRKQSLYELAKKTTDEQEKTQRSAREAIKASGREEIGKDFSAAGRVLELQARPGTQALADRDAEKLRLQYAKQIYDLDMADAAAETDSNKAILDQLKGILDLKTKAQDAERDHEIKMLELQKERETKTREVSSQVYDALRGGPKGISNLFTGIGNNIGKTIFENITQEAVKGVGGQNPLSRIVHNQTTTDADGKTKLSGIGRVLAGTPFSSVGADAKDMVLTKSNDLTDINNKVTQELNDLLKKLMAPKSASSATGDSAAGVVLGPGGTVMGSSVGVGSSQAQVAEVGLPSDGSTASHITADSKIAANAVTTGSQIAAQVSSGNIAGAVASALAATPSIIGQVSKALSPATFPAEPNQVNALLTDPFAGTKYAGGVEFNDLQNQGQASVKSSSIGPLPTDPGAFTTAGGRSSVAGALFSPGPDTTKADMAVSGVATAGVLYGAERGIAAGIRQGGPQGYAGALEAGLGAAAALDPEPISKAILGASAMVTGIVKGFLPDPKQQRADDEARTLQLAEYLAPTKIADQTDQNGVNTGYNKFGQVASNGTRGFSFTNSQLDSHNINGIRNFYTTPGTVTEPYQAGYTGPAQSGQTVQYITNMSVHALDSQSILDRSGDITSAVHKELRAGNAIGNAIQQAVLGS